MSVSLRQARKPPLLSWWQQERFVGTIPTVDFLDDEQTADGLIGQKSIQRMSEEQCRNLNIQTSTDKTATQLGNAHPNMYANNDQTHGTQTAGLKHTDKHRQDRNSIGRHTPKNIGLKLRDLNTQTHTDKTVTHLGHTHPKMHANNNQTHGTPTAGFKYTDTHKQDCDSVGQRTRKMQ
jgi:hypothetical protein